MNPVSHKRHIKLTAEELDLPDELVEDVVEFYYSIVRDMLSKGVDIRIVLYKFGTFKIRKKVLKKMLEEKRESLRYMGIPRTANALAKKQNLEAEVEKLIRLQSEIDSENEARKEFDKNKK